jgi:hypothetical protein
VRFLEGCERDGGFNVISQRFDNGFGVLRLEALGEFVEFSVPKDEGPGVPFVDQNDAGGAIDFPGFLGVQEAVHDHWQGHSKTDPPVQKLDLLLGGGIGVFFDERQAVAGGFVQLEKALLLRITTCRQRGGSFGGNSTSRNGRNWSTGRLVQAGDFGVGSGEGGAVLGRLAGKTGAEGQQGGCTEGEKRCVFWVHKFLLVGQHLSNRPGQNFTRECRFGISPWAAPGLGPDQSSGDHVSG